MQLDDIIEALGRRSAYPFEVDDLEVRQTHISVVFLVDDRVFKLKKPVDFGFVDYSTRERRRYFCRREVALNRRLAPTVYRGVVPVVERGDGFAVEADARLEPEDVPGQWEGEAVEWAVEMRRLPEDHTLETRVAVGGIDADAIGRVGRFVADFHAEAATGSEISECARFEAVAGNARDNFEQSRDQVGTTVHSEVFARLERSNERVLERHRELIEERADREVARDTHGDLRLDHVYVFPERPEHDDLVIIDCIEFNDAFRYADPVADMAFLAMDLASASRRDLAAQFADAYFERTGDQEGRRLLDFYVAYRAAVRAKVEGLKATEAEVPTDERRQARDQAMAHWLLALGRLEPPERRPALVMVGGLPGVGKSTVARRLADRAGFAVVDTDVVRKRLAGLSPETEASAKLEGGIYTEAWSQRTYAECRRRAENHLFAGGRVIVDATFYSRDRRRQFADLAEQMGVPVVMLECTASPEVVAERIEARPPGVSDADREVYEHIREKWEPYGDGLSRRARQVSTEGEIRETVQRAVDVLEEEGLC